MPRVMKNLHKRGISHTADDRDTTLLSADESLQDTELEIKFRGAPLS